MLDFSRWPRIVVELGMGDGRLLESLAKSDTASLYVGIELDREQCRQAQSRMTALDNVKILNGSFEEILTTFPDGSVDRFIAVLPDPAYIDTNKQELWSPLYEVVLRKLKETGTFELVTEITDELLQPVSNEAYEEWASWLKSTFLSIGFSLNSQKEGAPERYHSRCLDQFRSDPERIRMITLEFAKR
ncbi:MAG TPA: methyltransferase domain-containing protein [Nitrososphaera sp.]|nr:methyltransferase domain-containing protein [Nitrososphaera sp.]